MITIHAHDAFLAVSFPFRLLARFKEVIPRGYRWWDADGKRWLVNPPAYDLLEDEWPDLLEVDYDAWRLIVPPVTEAQSTREWRNAQIARTQRAKYGRRVKA